MSCIFLNRVSVSLLGKVMQKFEEYIYRVLNYADELKNSNDRSSVSQLRYPGCYSWPERGDRFYTPLLGQVYSLHGASHCFREHMFELRELNKKIEIVKELAF